MQNIQHEPATSASLRHSKKFKRLQEKFENVHFSNDQLGIYLKAFPEMAGQAACAEKIARFEPAVVAKVIDEVFCYFPFDQIGYGKDKCIRDVTLVSVSITHSMLMNDVDWMADSLLYWMKTIIQAMGFPAEEKNDDLIKLQADASSLETLVKKSRSMPPHVASIYVTYTRLGQRYKSMLTESDWLLIKDQFQATIEILSKK